MCSNLARGEDGVVYAGISTGMHAQLLDPKAQEDILYVNVNESGKFPAVFLCG